MEYVRWGIIGCGEVTETKSGPVFDMVEHSQVVAVMNSDKAKAEQYAVKHGIDSWYDDVFDLLKDDAVNAVYIATPPSTHATYAIMAMKAGKAVYVEKPMAASYEDCCRMNRISEETGMPCFVAYYRRYLPYFLKVKSLVSEGSIGRVIGVRIDFSQPEVNLDYSAKDLPWRIQPDITGYGFFYDLVPHQIDVVQDICGCILDAYGCNSGAKHDFDTISCCFSFENDIVGAGSWCFGADNCTDEDKVEIIGTDGKIKFSVFTFAPIKLTDKNGVREFNVDNPRFVQYPLIESVIKHLQGKAVCECSGINATPTSWVLDKIMNRI